MFNNFAKSFEKHLGTKLPGTGSQQQQQQYAPPPPQYAQPSQMQYQKQQQQQQYAQPNQMQYPYPHQSGPPPQCTHPCGPRRALLIGINYTGQRGELRGCVNDVRCMEFLLTTKVPCPCRDPPPPPSSGPAIADPPRVAATPATHEQYGYHQSAILTLTDDQTDTARTPTRQNMMQAMQWLIGARGATEPGGACRSPDRVKMPVDVRDRCGL